MLPHRTIRFRKSVTRWNIFVRWLICVRVPTHSALHSAFAPLQHLRSISFSRRMILSMLTHLLSCLLYTSVGAGASSSLKMTGNRDANLLSRHLADLCSKTVGNGGILHLKARSLKFLFYHFGLFQRQSALCHCKDGKAFSGLVALLKRLDVYKRQAEHHSSGSSQYFCSGSFSCTDAFVLEKGVGTYRCV